MLLAFSMPARQRHVGCGTAIPCQQDANAAPKAGDVS
jgi:hypothetical protein